MPLGLTHQINRVTGYRRQANRVIYPVYPVGVPPLPGSCPGRDLRVATEYSTGLYYLEIIKISFG